ncbi:MAG: retropepsin-like aspartic protease [Alistipes putredinis]
MKKLLLALFLVFTLPLSAEEQPAVPTADEQAATLINAQEWFRLEACYPEIRDELSPFVRLLCEASLGSHFNRLPESCNAIGTLLNDYQQELFADPEGSMLGWLLSMLIGNLQELGAYEQAADLLTQFAAGQSEEERASTLATQRWFQTMARHPRTSLTKPDGEIRLPLTVGSETVKSPLDGTDKKVHNFYTDITIGGRTERFIFDTGCSGASFVSAEFAKRHDLEIICDSISVSGIGGNGFVKFATTDSMQIGPVTIRHSLLHGLRQRRGFGPNRPYRSRPRHRLHASGRPDRASPQRGFLSPARHSGTDPCKRAKPDARHLLGTIYSQHARRRKRHRPDGLRHGQLPHGTFAELLHPAPRRDRPQREKAGNGRRRFRRNFARYGLRPEEYNLHDRQRLPHPEKGDRHS